VNVYIKFKCLLFGRKWVTRVCVCVCCWNSRKIMNILSGAIWTEFEFKWCLWWGVKNFTFHAATLQNLPLNCWNAIGKLKTFSNWIFFIFLFILLTLLPSLSLLLLRSSSLMCTHKFLMCVWWNSIYFPSSSIPVNIWLYGDTISLHY
jgi:hypothetical protein